MFLETYYKDGANMKYNFDEIIDRRNTGSVKWDFGEQLKEFGITDHFNDETIPLFTADMDIAVAPQIIEAMHQTADTRIYGYTLPKPEYYDAIISWFQRRHDWQIKKEEIVYCPGTVHAIEIAIKAYTNEGDGVIIQRPVYTPFTRNIEGNNRIVANNQLKVDEKGYYRIDLQHFEELAKRPENRMFILCNPHNPTGRVFSREELSILAKICFDNNVVIVADEIHGDLIRHDSHFIPIVKTTNQTSHIVTCTAINKTFNVAGLHASAIIINDQKMRKQFQRTLGMGLPTPFTINAVVAAYNECEEWLEELKTYLDGTIEWVMSFLKEKMPKVRFSRPEGTYIFWMDFREYGLTVEEIKKRIYVDANVVLESGKMFDPDFGDGFERVCLSSPRPIITEAFERIYKAFQDLN